MPASQTTQELGKSGKEGMRGGGGGGGERRSQSERTGVFLYLQNLQIAQRSESSIFDAADVVAVQLPAPCIQTHTRRQIHTHIHTQMRERWERVKRKSARSPQLWEGLTKRLVA